MKNKLNYIDSELLISNSISNDYQSIIINGNLNITIEKDNALQWIANNSEVIYNGYLNTDIINSLPPDMILTYNIEDIRGSFNKRYDTVNNAFIIADEKNMKLFYYKKAYYIANLERFKKHKIKAIKHNYALKVNIIATLPIIDRRNTKTLRLYNNFISFPNTLLRFIRFNSNTLVQIDLRTSQFLLFANLLNQYINDGAKCLFNSFSKSQNVNYLKRFVEIMDKHKTMLPSTPIDINNSNSCKASNNDVHQFIRDVFFGDFYDIISKRLNLNNRLIAKQLLFQIFFASKLNYNDEYVNKLANNYPTVMSIIADFKKIKNDKKKKKVSNKPNLINPKIDKDNSNNFPVFLQCIEAEIFIDNILFKLRDKNIPVASRHDSIITTITFAEEVENYMKIVFNNLGFRFNYKVDDMMWISYSYDEFEDIDLFDWFADQDLLYGDNYYDINENKSNYKIESELVKNLKIIFNSEITMVNDDYVDEYFSLENIDNDNNLKERFINQIFENLNDIELPVNIMEDYFQHIGIYELYCLSVVDGLLNTIKHAIEEDIINLQSNHPVSFFQENTNKLISILIQIQ